MRLGFVVKPLARPGLKSHDSRRWQNNPHLSVSLAYLRDIFRYLVEARISMYRISSELAPYLTHPDMPQFHDQLTECATELAVVGESARAADLRLSFHPSQYVVLNAPDADLVARGVADLNSQAMILDMMGLGPEAVVVTHVGGIYGDRRAACERFVQAYFALPEPARRRLVLENDDTRFGVADTLWIHERTGIRLVFDNLHHRLHNPDGRSPRGAGSLPGDLARGRAAQDPLQQPAHRMAGGAPAGPGRSAGAPDALGVSRRLRQPLRVH